MKNTLLSLFIIYTLSASAQAGKKDTVKLDSTQIEKIKKMPEDTVPHKTPVIPLTPPKNPKNKETPIRKKVLV